MKPQVRLIGKSLSDLAVVAQITRAFALYNDIVSGDGHTVH